MWKKSHKEISLEHKSSYESVIIDLDNAAFRGEDGVLFKTTLSSEVIDKLKELGLKHSFVMSNHMIKSLVLFN